MSLLTSLFRLIPPTFKVGYCPKTPQELANAIIGGTQVTFLIQSGSFLYNMGSTTPTQDNRIFPWLRTTDGLWYSFQFGLWVSPMDPSEREPSFRKMWKPANGTLESALWGLDGGDGSDPSVTPPTNISGAAWVVDHDMDGIFPIGVGAIPGSDPAASVALGGTGGSPQHKLTEAEGGNGIHTHPIGVCDPASDDAVFPLKSSTTVPGWNGHEVTGGGTQHNPSETTANLFSLASGSDGKGVPDPTAFSIMPPYRGIYWIRPTIKLFYTLPA